MGNELDIFYFQVTDLWKKLCEEHNDLFSLTCEEYSHLLTSDIDSLNRVTEEKQKIIDSISVLEKVRRKLIDEINSLLPFEEKIENVSGLLALMSSVEKRTQQKHLFHFNQFLIDIIERLQEQNKKNQIFLNKAMNSLKDIREEVMGTKSYSTYTADGKTISKRIQNQQRSHP